MSVKANQAHRGRSCPYERTEEVDTLHHRDGTGGVARVRIRPAVLAPLIIVPVLTMAVLVAHGGMFEAPPRGLPDGLCPVDGSSRKEQHPREYVDHAPPYTGHGPHLAVLIGVSQEGEQVLLTDLLPASWAAQDGDWMAHGDDWRFDAQLVVCQYRQSTDVTVDSCRFMGDVTVPLRRTVYTYRVYEARTGEPLTEFRVDGSGCPDRITTHNGTPPPYVGQSVDTKALENGLRPLVDRPLAKPSPGSPTSDSPPGPSS